MTQQEIIEGGKAIDKWLGIERVAKSDWWWQNRYPYRKDWNELMDLVKQIRDILENPSVSRFDYELFAESEAAKIIHLTIWAEKDTVFEAVALFAQWYNQNKG